MIIELLLKDFRRLHPKKKGFKGATFFRLIFGIIAIGLVEALIVYIYQGVDKKISVYSELASFAILVFFLGLLGIFLCVSGALTARKLIFDDDDRQIVFPLPISSATYLISKILYVYITILLECLLLSLPILCTYLSLRSYTVYYYVGAVIYPIIVSLFYMGVALLVSLLFEFIYLRIKDNDIIQFILASALMILLCVAYYYFLNLFLVTLQDGSINGVISPTFVSGLSDIMIIFSPTFELLDMFIAGDYGVANLFMTGGLLLISVAAGYVATYTLYRSGKLAYNRHAKEEEEEKEIPIRHGFKNLLKKELDILFKDSSNMFSYTSLLILLPFLSYAVVSSFNAIFAMNYTMVLAYYPELFHIIVLALILLFIGSINASSSLSMSNEKGGIVVTKTLPSSLKSMLYAKLVAPSALSFFSYLISIFVLLVAGQISFVLYITALALGIILILVQNVLGMLMDMKDKGSNGGKRVVILNNLLSFALPVLILVMGLPMSFNGFSSGTIYMSLVLVTLALGAISFIGIGGRMKKAFYEMEVR